MTRQAASPKLTPAEEKEADVLFHRRLRSVSAGAPVVQPNGAVFYAGGHSLAVQASKTGEYLIRLFPSITCSCPAFGFSKTTPRSCKHVAGLSRLIETLRSAGL